ncbi:inorganic pyrophosphatase, partial [Plasmodium malariae]
KNVVTNLKRRKMSSSGVIYENDRGEMKDKKNDYFIETNKEVKVNLNFHNNNIISNIFSNLNLYDKRNNIFINNNKTYMVKYCNQINEDNFHITYLQKVNNDFVPISPWHHIDLMNEDGTYNMIVEISKYNYIKLEIKLNEKFNIIKQDTKKGKLRYYHNSIYWNYGALPRTYEYPKHIYTYQTNNNQQLFFTGDDDPLDIVDIGKNSLKMGQVVPVKVCVNGKSDENDSVFLLKREGKAFCYLVPSLWSLYIRLLSSRVLGAFTLIDEGQLDWKIIAINKEDSNFEKINSLEDVEKYYPYTLSLLLEWFRSYKMAESKVLNIISKKLYNKKESEDLIAKTHEYYLEFLNDVKEIDGLKTDESISGKCSTNISTSNSTELNLNMVPYKTHHDDSTYNTLLQDIDISYYRADPLYKPNACIWTP